MPGKQKRTQIHEVLITLTKKLKDLHSSIKADKILHGKKKSHD